MLRFGLLFIFALIACATPQTKAPSMPTKEILEEVVFQLEPTFHETMAKQERIKRIAGPILWDNAELCKSRLRFGFNYIDLHTTQNLDRAYRELYVRYYDLPTIYPIPTIIELDPGSPAEISRFARWGSDKKDKRAACSTNKKD